MARTILTVVYVVAAICELAGIALTVHGLSGRTATAPFGG